ncbi:MAG: hypothetical protein PHO10_10915, partial [Gemmiger sp.]|nr:hypothetical protein [Gemmiger sp.]
MEKWYRSKRLLTQMLMLVCVSLFLLLVMFFIILGQTLKGFQKTNEEYIENMTTQLANTINTNYTSLDKIVRLACYNSALQSFLLCEDEADRFSYYVEASRNLSDVTAMNDLILNVIFTDSSGQRYNLGDNIYPLTEMDLTDNTLHVSNLLHTQSISAEIGYLILGKEIRSADRYQKTNQWIGNIYFVLQPATFTSSEKSADYGGNIEIYFIDGENTVLWKNSPGDTQEKLDSALQNPAALTYFTEQNIEALPGFRIVACQRAPLSLFRVMNWQTGYLFVLAVVLLFIIMLWVVWGRNVARPITQLTSFVEQIDRDELSGLKSSVMLHGYQEAVV